MRIAIFSDNFYPEIGGIQDCVLWQAKELVKRGHKVDCYVPKYAAKDYKIAGLPVKELDLGKSANIHREFSLPFPSGTLQSRIAFPVMKQLFALKKHKPDIIHTHSFFGLGLEAILIAKLLNIPVVGTNHWAMPEFYRFTPLKTKRLGSMGLKYLIWYFNKCDFVTSPSRYVMQEMIQEGYNNLYKIISNPIDIATFRNYSKETKKILKKKFNLSNNTIVYAGRIAPEKSLSIIIKSLPYIKKQIPDITFALAGHGSGEKKLFKLAKKLKVEDRLRFLGTLDKQELAGLYHGSELFVMTSATENQSMSMLQAMACGLPVIGADYRSIPEVITDGKNGYLVPINNYKELSKKIIYLLLNRDAYKAFSKEALKSVKKYSVSTVAKQFEEVYELAIAKRKLEDTSSLPPEFIQQFMKVEPDYKKYQRQMGKMLKATAPERVPLIHFPLYLRNKQS